VTRNIFLHLEAWSCALYGEAAFSMNTRQPHCAYCQALDPNTDYLEQHHSLACHGHSKKAQHFHHNYNLAQNKLESFPLVDD
jgi:hypothetical protein